jgi:cystathionine beta-lyase
MIYNFDEVIDRRNTDALKLEALQPRWGRTDLIPLWVADMDFRTPPFIIKALRDRLENEILGYTVKPDSWYDSIINWVISVMAGRFPRNDELYTGHCAGIGYVDSESDSPGRQGDGATPVYHPFFLITQHNNREVVYNPLVLENGQFRMDMERFKEDVKGCKLFILCNPHNPGGRVWTKEELIEVARICDEKRYHCGV